MSLQEPHEAALETVDLPALRDHIETALEHTENDHTRYHLREAYQKLVILEEE